jgi:hypothetical protein
MGLRMRRGGTHHRPEPEGPPPLLEGQTVSLPKDSRGEALGPNGGPRRTPGSRRGKAREDRSRGPGAGVSGAGRSPLDAAELGLPTDGPALVRYLANSYKGVGQKTAETLVKEFGTDLYRVMRDLPERLTPVIPAKRAEQLLRGWRADYARRVERAAQEPGPSDPTAEEDPPVSWRRTRKGSRGRGRGAAVGGEGGQRREDGEH